MDALAEQHRELDALLAPLEDGAARRPSRCEGWTVADVVLHLAQSDELAVASITGRVPAGTSAIDLATAGPGGGTVTSTDEWAEASVARERDALQWSELRDRWRATAAALVDVARRADPHERVPWVIGELPVRTLATTRLAEAWIHTGDVAEALGAPIVSTERLWHIARLAWRTLPYAFARAGRGAPGAVALELKGPNGETWDFRPDGVDDLDEPPTVVRGAALDLCLVAARRADPRTTSLSGTGPDADAVLELIRTYA